MMPESWDPSNNEAGCVHGRSVDALHISGGGSNFSSVVIVDFIWIFCYY